MLEQPSEADASLCCAQCSHRAVWQFQLDRHIRKNHGNLNEAYHGIVQMTRPEPYFCVRCGFKSYHKLGLHEHFKHRHDVGLGRAKDEENINTRQFDKACYPCHNCNYKGHSSLFLFKHLQCPCEMPQKIPPSPNVIFLVASTIKRETTENLKKDISKGSVSCRGEVKLHLETHMSLHVATDEETNRFKCSLCSYRCRIKSSLRSHTLMKHATDEEINWVQCKLCSYRAKVKSSVKTHFLAKHAAIDEIIWFQCSQCSYRAKHKHNLKRHMVKHAVQEDIDWFQCDRCSYRAKLKSNLTAHVLMKHARNDEINWFQCNHCSYRAKQKPHLQRHMLLHATNEDINWFQCGRCSYRAKQKSNLKTHMLKHAK